MKFSDLYNRVFVKEQEDVTTPEDTEVAIPEDFDDVDPAPVISPTEPELGAEETPMVTDGGDTGATNLTTFVQELEDFATKLNAIEGSSLQRTLAKLDKAGTPFEGISDRTKGEIVNASKSLQSIAERLKEFIIHAIKAK